MEECWKPISSFLGYEISSLGRVRSFHKITGKGKWEIVNKPQRILRPSKCNGYEFVNLRKDGESFLKRIHKLVIEAFIGSCPEGLEVCHNDGKKENNKFSNLRYGTHQENMSDSAKHGTRNLSGKIGEEGALEIRMACANGETDKALAEKYGCSEYSIRNIRLGSSYSWIGGPRIKRRELKLTKEDANWIRRWVSKGHRQSDMADIFNVSRSMICLIVNDLRWANNT